MKKNQKEKPEYIEITRNQRIQHLIMYVIAMTGIALLFFTSYDANSPHDGLSHPWMGFLIFGGIFSLAFLPIIFGFVKAGKKPRGPVFNEEDWHEWCSEKGLQIKEGLFANKICFYGIGWRTRAGTLLISKQSIIHHSYSFKDMQSPTFEKSKQIKIFTSEIRSVQVIPMSLLFKILNNTQKYYSQYIYPQMHIRLEMRNGDKHDFLLREGAQECLDAFHALRLR